MIFINYKGAGVCLVGKQYTGYCTTNHFNINIQRISALHIIVDKTKLTDFQLLIFRDKTMDGQYINEKQNKDLVDFTASLIQKYFHMQVFLFGTNAGPISEKHSF